MGTRSRITLASGKIRPNHDKKTALTRQLEKARRKFDRPIYQLRGARAVFRDITQSRTSKEFKARREWMEAQEDLPPKYLDVLNQLAAAESAYINYLADTQLQKGYYHDHKPSMELKTRIDRAAIIAAEADAETNVAQAQDLVSDFTGVLCRRQYLPGTRKQRSGN